MLLWGASVNMAFLLSAKSKSSSYIQASVKTTSQLHSSIFYPAYRSSMTTPVKNPSVITFNAKTSHSMGVLPVTPLLLLNGPRRGKAPVKTDSPAIREQFDAWRSVLSSTKGDKGFPPFKNYFKDVSPHFKDDFCCPDGTESNKRSRFAFKGPL